MFYVNRLCSNLIKLRLNRIYLVIVLALDPPDADLILLTTMIDVDLHVDTAVPAVTVDIVTEVLLAGTTMRIEVDMVVLHPVLVALSTTILLLDEVVMMSHTAAITHLQLILILMAILDHMIVHLHGISLPEMHHMHVTTTAVVIGRFSMFFCEIEMLTDADLAMSLPL